MATATLSFFTPPRSTSILKQQPPSFICKTNSPVFNTSPISSSNPPFCFLRRGHFSCAPPKSSKFLPKSSSTEAAAEEAPVIDVEPTQSDQETPKREQVFAVVMIGSRQYIVFPGRYLTTQRLKGANVDDKIILNKVLLVGTKTGTQTATYIGEPVVTNAVVHAVVEDVGLNPKVVVYKYKKRKNYRRNIGHRQPNTRIRITGITGYQDFPAVTMDSLKPAA